MVFLDTLCGGCTFVFTFSGTGLYSWEYGIGKFATGKLFFVLPWYGATDHFSELYGGAGYFNVGRLRDHILFWRTDIRGHGSLPVYMLNSHRKHTGLRGESKFEKCTLTKNLTLRGQGVRGSEDNVSLTLSVHFSSFHSPLRQICSTGQNVISNEAGL